MRLFMKRCTKIQRFMSIEDIFDSDPRIEIGLRVQWRLLYHGTPQEHIQVWRDTFNLLLR